MGKCKWIMEPFLAWVSGTASGMTFAAVSIKTPASWMGFHHQKRGFGNALFVVDDLAKVCLQGCAAY